MGEPENAIQKYCYDVTKLWGWMPVRQNQNYKGRNAFREPGVPDIICCLKSGHWLGIECKTPDGKQSDEQKAYEKAVKKNNGLYVVIREEKELHGLKEELQALRWA